MTEYSPCTNPVHASLQETASPWKLWLLGKTLPELHEAQRSQACWAETSILRTCVPKCFQREEDGDGHKEPKGLERMGQGCASDLLEVNMAVKASTSHRTPRTGGTPGSWEKDGQDSQKMR